jgi:hypothetical protein
VLLRKWHGNPCTSSPSTTSSSNVRRYADLSNFANPGPGVLDTLCFLHDGCWLSDFVLRKELSAREPCLPTLQERPLVLDSSQHKDNSERHMSWLGMGIVNHASRLSATAPIYGANTVRCGPCATLYPRAVSGATSPQYGGAVSTSYQPHSFSPCPTTQSMSFQHHSLRFTPLFPSAHHTVPLPSPSLAGRRHLSDSLSRGQR